MLLEGQDGTRESHTGVWIAELVLRTIDEIGKERIGAVSSDNTGNTRVARDIICSNLPHVLNLPDPEHHLNNTWKDIASLEYFVSVGYNITWQWRSLLRDRHSSRFPAKSCEPSCESRGPNCESRLPKL